MVRGVSEFQLKSQEISQHVVNTTATCILTVAGGQSAACLRTFVEVRRDRSAASRDVRGRVAFPTASPSKLISNPSITDAVLCPGPHGPAQTFLHQKPLGGINQVFQRYLDAKDQEVSSRISDRLKQSGGWCSMENVVETLSNSAGCLDQLEVLK